MLHHPVYMLVAIIATAVLGLLLMLRAREERSRSTLERTLSLDVKPISRHPIVDPMKCLLCGSCVSACPERGDDGNGPLAIVGGKVVLVNPLQCIGHGECQSACPTGAIALGLGDLVRDPTLPRLTDENETDVPGIFVAGELSGIGLIKNSVAQARKVIAAIEGRVRGLPRERGTFDVVVVGLGPAGLAASLAAAEAGLDYLAIEQGALGGTVANFPRQKVVLSDPVDLPLYGRIEQRELTKEQLLAIWHAAADKAKLRARYGEKLESVRLGEDGVFRVATATASARTRTVVLAIGRRGSPRRLGIPGEERTKVAHGLLDPSAIRGQKVLVVGGGNSAIEAAIALTAANEVSLSYRRAEFFRLHPKNQREVEAAIEGGRIAAFYESRVVEIGERHVALRCGDEDVSIENDQVFVLAGGEPPFEILRQIGILRDVPSETAHADPA